ncbi:WD40-repeat-containing domain protein [Chytridium lagenaria]|nr:WD40-repeat-containing domain protein [Chytridium lagenaria]
MSIPQAITFEDHVFDFSFHPERSIVAASLITGAVVCKHLVTEGPIETAFTVDKHKESCRAVEFSHGLDLYSGGADRSLIVTDPVTGKMKLRKPDAHSEPINRILSIGPAMVASGDDAGVVKVWDVRQKKEVRRYTDSMDYIADLAISGDGKRCWQRGWEFGGV